MWLVMMFFNKIAANDGSHLEDQARPGVKDLNLGSEDDELIISIKNCPDNRSVLNLVGHDIKNLVWDKTYSLIKKAGL